MWQTHEINFTIHSGSICRWITPFSPPFKIKIMKSFFIRLLCFFTAANSISQSDSESIIKIASAAASTSKVLSDKNKQQKNSEPAQIIKSEKYYLGGEVTDGNGHKVSGVVLVLTLGNELKQTATDVTGFYVFEFDLNPATVGAIPAKISYSKGSCSNQESFHLTRRLVSKDLKLDCSSGGSTPPATTSNSNQPPIKSFKKDNLIIEILECRQAGQEVECSFRIHAKEKDVVFWISGGEENSRLFEASSGNEYYADQLSLAEKYHNREIDKKIIAGYPVKGSITFTDVTKRVDLISVLQLNCWTDIAGYFNAELRDIPVKN